MLPTRTANLSAQTSNGGVFINNTGNVAISGGVLSGVNGIQCTSIGSVVLNNAGSVTATTFYDTIRRHQASLSPPAAAISHWGAATAGVLTVFSGPPRPLEAQSPSTPPEICVVGSITANNFVGASRQAEALFLPRAEYQYRPRLRG